MSGTGRRYGGYAAALEAAGVCNAKRNEQNDSGKPPPHILKQNK